MFSERQRRIVAILADATEPVTGQELALACGVSVRTIQGDIASINRSEHIIQSSNRGYTTTRDALNTLSPAIPDESISHSALQVLVFDGRQRIDDLSEQLYVSTPTLERHLRTLGPKLEPYRLKLERKQGWVWISGDEADKRRFIGSLIAQESGDSFGSANIAPPIFKGMDRALVRSIVVSTVESLRFRIRPGFENNLLGSITVALYRMRENPTETVNANTPDSVTTDDRIEYRIARELCRRYAAHFNVEPASSDQVYLAHLLRGQIEAAADVSIASPTIQQDEFVREVERIVSNVLDMFTLPVASAQSLYNFAMHVDALLCRGEDSQIKDEGVLENVKRHMPFIYEIALLVSDRLARHFGIHISGGEIGFICIHMGMILHSTMEVEHVSIGLACLDYHGISERVREGILERFSGVVTIFDLPVPFTSNDLLGLPLDLVVTTQHMGALPVPSVEVSPFYSPADSMAVETAVNTCLKRKHAARTRQLIDTFLDPNLFFKTDELATKREAIMFLGSKLQKYGVVDGAFTESVLRREKLSSTCFFELFSIPHAVEMNATRTMVAILVSERGVMWDDVPIHVVLMIAVNKDDRKQFVELYNSMVKSLWSGKRVARIMRANTLGEFLDELTHE